MFIQQINNENSTYIWGATIAWVEQQAGKHIEWIQDAHTMFQVILMNILIKICVWNEENIVTEIKMTKWGKTCSFFHQTDNLYETNARYSYTNSFRRNISF